MTPPSGELDSPGSNAGNGGTWPLCPGHCAELGEHQGRPDAHRLTGEIHAAREAAGTIAGYRVASFGGGPTTNNAAHYPLVVNLKPAKATGIALPPNLPALADEIIE